MNTLKTVIVLGKGDLCIKVAQFFLDSAEYHLITTVPNQPESPWAPSLRAWAEQQYVPWVSTGRTRDIPGYDSGDQLADLAVSVTYDRILREQDIARFGKVINIHNGPLPEYRGVNPINWALKNGEREHGVTIHEITPGIDDGPIISSIRFPIDPEKDEVIEVYRRCLEGGWELFQQTMPNLSTITPEPQDESRARYYSAKDFPLLEERRFFTRAESR